MKKNLYLILLAFFAIYVIWGSTYLMNKLVVTELPPMFLGSIRFTVAGLLIFLIAKILGHKLSITKKELINTIIAGFFFLAYGNGVFVWALKYLDTGFAALEASINPLLILIIMRIYHKKAIKPKSIIGILLGIVGMYVLVSQNELTFQEGSTFGIIMIFTCVLSWSIGSVFVAEAKLPKNFFISTGYQMLASGILLMIASLLFQETWTSPLQWQQKTQFAMIGLIILGSIVAFTSFNYLLKNVSTEKVATSGYVNPVIALLLGWYFLGEQITSQTIVAAVLLLLGVYFINSRKNPKAPKSI